ncbi:MAG: hypothetical protein AB1498_01085 [bacterium]
MYETAYAATVPRLKYPDKESLVIQMFRLLFPENEKLIPSDSKLILATIKGEIDLLEGYIAAGLCGFDPLLEKVSEISGIKGNGTKPIPHIFPECMICLPSLN